jgi:putative phage-type endonuclease
VNDLVVTESAEESARALWLRERLSGIGSSDAAAVAGVSPWRTPVDVWLEKTEQLAPRDDDDTGPTYWGRMLEALVIAEYSKRTGSAVGQRNELIRHKLYPWMLATVDAIAIPPVGGPRPVEAKTTRWAKEWGDPESDEVPLLYVFQVQHQLAVTGYQVADIPVLIGGNDFRLYRVERDEAIIAALIEVEREFWQAVVDRRPPPIRTTGDAAKLFPAHVRGVARECGEPEFELYREWQEIRATLERAKKRDDEIKAALQAFMEDAELLTFQGEVLATWRKTAPIRRVDSKKLQREHPEAYAACIKPNDGERRFLNKGEG